MFRHDPTLIALIHADRVNDAEQRARTRRLAPPRIGRQPIRRTVGHQLVRIGTTLADDPSPKPARRGVVRPGAQRT